MTRPLAVVSPVSTPIGTLTLFVLVPSFTPCNVTVTVCPLATLVSGMVTMLPLTVAIPPLSAPPLPTVAVPEVTCACGLPVMVTGFEKVTMIV